MDFYETVVSKWAVADDRPKQLGDGLDNILVFAINHWRECADRPDPEFATHAAMCSTDGRAIGTIWFAGNRASDLSDAYIVTVDSHEEFPPERIIRLMSKYAS